MCKAFYIRMTAITFLIIWALIGCIGATEKHWPRVDIYQPNFHQAQRYRDTRSVDDAPSLEVLMHLPPDFKDINSFRHFFGIRPERRRRDVSRAKRSVEVPDSVVVDSSQVTVEERESEMPYRPELQPIQIRQYVDNVPEFDINGDDVGVFSNNGADRQGRSSAEARKSRRNTSANDHEDSKRSYPEPPAPTTVPPFWKQQKKPSAPTFVTQREGRGQSSYDIPQHRNNPENSRESHSMKEKPMQSNEILPARDSYYAASDPSTRRAYNSRQAESTSPKSAYDTMDFSSANRRGGAGRNADSRGRLTTDSYSYTRSFSNPQPYDSRYYYPLPGEIASRGLEYYHRTVDPGTGRIIYYATLPEPSPGFDARTLPGRAYTMDAYGRPYPTVPSYPYYPSYPAYNNPSFPAYNPAEYLRPGRNTAESYQRYEDRFRDDRNKTYVIYDADEKRLSGSKRPLDDRQRYLPTGAYPAPYTFPQGYNFYSPYPSYNIYRNPYYQDARGLIGGDIGMSRDPYFGRPVETPPNGSFDNKQNLKPLKQ